MSSEPETRSANDKAPTDDSAAHEATVVIVRGEAVRDQDAKSAAKDPQPQDSKSQDSKSDSQPKDNSQPKDKEKSPPPQLSEEKVKLRARLPALDDDGDVGTQNDHIVTRDGKPDLAFKGTLLASAAPSTAPKGEWDEYRVYETTAGKHVFSKIKRNVSAEKEDTHEAEVFDPTPTSMPSKLLKSARDLTHTHEKTWADAAAEFFGYDSLAKELYRKLGGQFEEHIS